MSTLKKLSEGWVVAAAFIGAYAAVGDDHVDCGCRAGWHLAGHLAYEVKR